MEPSFRIYMGIFWILTLILMNLKIGYANDKYDHRIRSGARGKIQKRSARIQAPIYVYRSRKSCLTPRAFYAKYPPSEILAVSKLIYEASINDLGMEKLSRSLDASARMG
ncbi:uncharacterized protein LOC111626010 [Centruroides sculpturatus]|uniref:uncharacterized protein LOC111626010 n=1 Tax=Centruroides sculpturatus TaxID=218467 RepID=UPI000C6DBD1C|nr:uncharacterized protein LOC111626010 [Centruroides sculpturatus]